MSAFFDKVAVKIELPIQVLATGFEELVISADLAGVALGNAVPTHNYEGVLDITL